MDKSIIISYKESSEERKRNLQYVLDYLSYIQDSKTEILIIEQDTESKIDWLDNIRGNDFIKHIFVKNDGIFNKGWGYNIGAKNALSNILIFHDSDLFIRPQTYGIAINTLKTCDVVNPYQSVIFLDDESSINFKSHKYSFLIANKFKPIIHTVMTGGIFFMKKEAFMKLKGFDEDCYGYGHEDDILDEKIKKTKLVYKTLNDTAIHIYHEVSNGNTGLYYSFLGINKELFKQYTNLTEIQLKNKISKIDNWGDINSNITKDLSIRHIKRELYKKTSSELVDYLLSKFTDDYLDEIVNDVTTKIYNGIADSISEKVKNVLKDIKFKPNEKENFIKNIMRKFNL